MKKIYVSLLIAVLTLGGSEMFGQAQRMVLIEEGTNASCQPCAVQNPGFHSLLESVADKNILLSYQWWFPGYDPMHEHNPSEVNQRFEDYYGNNGVPTAMIDGTVPGNSYPGFSASYDGAPAGYSAQMINDRYDVETPFEISIDYTLTPSEIEATVTVSAVGDIDASNLKLRIAVIEKVIAFDSPPGSTNMDTFYNVMKKFLPNASGINLMNSWTSGDSESFTESWEHENIYDYSELAIVAFVQNDSGKEVMQAAMADEGVLESAFANAGGVYGLTAPASICSGTNTIEPTVNLRNTGSATLTSCDITASINGFMETVNWTGSLELMDDEEVDFPEITFEALAGEDTELVITVTNTNSEVNEEDVLNSVSADIDLAPVAAYNVNLEIGLDNWPEETTWSLATADGSTIASGGPYDGQGYETIEESFELDAGCYVLTIEDEYGDGLHASQWGAFDNGTIDITDMNDNELLDYNGTTDFSELSVQFEVQSGVSVIENEQGLSSLVIFPNPVVNNATIQANFTESADVTIEVYDLTGKVVMAQDFGTQSAGQFITELDLNELSNGLYLLNLQAGEASAVQKLSVNK